MQLYAQIDLGTKAIVTRQEFAAPPEALPAATMRRWVPDTVPSYDPATHRLVSPATVPDNATQVPYTVETIALEEIIGRRLNALAALRFEKETAGLTLSLGGQEVLITTDRDSQGLVDSLQRCLADGVIASVEFQAANDVIVTVNPALALALRTAVVLHVQACRGNQAEHARAIMDLESAAAVLAYDFTGGWPA